MDSAHFRIWGAVELAKAERRVAVTNFCVELQRELIEHLNLAGGDIGSAKIIFDSLLVSLGLLVADRQRLHEVVRAQAIAA
jgi:hypothetical protein